MFTTLRKKIISDKGILTFMWLTLLIGSGEAVITGRWSLLFLIFLTAALVAAPTVLERRYAIELPRGIASMIIFFTYMSLFLGEAYDFYEKFWWWDLFLHAASAVGFALISLGIVQMMESSGAVRINIGLYCFFAFGMTLSIGALWEILEFTLDGVFGFTMQNNSLSDTMADLIVDAGGAFIVCLFGYVHWKYGKENIIGHAVEKIFHKHLTKEN